MPHQQESPAAIQQFERTCICVLSSKSRALTHTLFRPPEDGSQLLADLRSSHTDEELLEAGLATRLPSNELVLSLSMESSDSNVLIVRDLETEVSVGVLTSHGPLNGELGIFADLDRCESVLLDADEGPLFFSASTLEDLAVLRGCGIPATLANGLDSLSPEDAAWLCKAYRVENLSLPSAIDDDDADQDCDDLDPMRVLARGLSGSNKADSPSPSAEEEASLSRPIPRVRRRLVLVGFDVAGLSNAIPASLNRVADHFGQLREHMGIDPGDVRVWQPDEMEVKRFKYFAEHGDATRLNKAMLESIADGLQDLPTYGTRPPPELEAKIALPEALTSFHRALRLSGHSMHAMEARQKAWRHLEEALDTELIEPTVEHALQAADPMERNLRLMAAMTARLAHVRALHLSAQTSIAMRQGGIDSLESLPQDGVKTVLALGKQMIALHKEISQCQNTTRILPMERFPREKPPLALLPSE